jgi:hypothetical protein
MTIRNLFVVFLVLLFPACSGGGAPPVPDRLENGVLDKQLDETAFRLEMAPALSILGENRVTIRLKEKDGTPIDDCHVNLSASSTLPGMKIERVEINHGQGGEYQGRLHFMSVGQWKLTIALHRFGMKEMKEVVLFDVIGHS